MARKLGFIFESTSAAHTRVYIFEKTCVICTKKIEKNHNKWYRILFRKNPTRKQTLQQYSYVFLRVGEGEQEREAWVYGYLV